MSAEKEVFREHLKECLEHLGKWFNSKIPKGSRSRSKAMKPMVDFFGASRQTVQRWLDYGEPPVGELRVKLMCYLNLHGYKVIEFERMPSAIQGFVELIGFGVFSWKEAAHLVGYDNSHHIFAIFWRKENTSKKKENLMWNLWKEHRDALEARKKEVWEKYRLNVLFEPVPAHKPIQLIQPVSNGKCNQNKLAIFSILENALSLIEVCLFENLSEQELAMFVQPILRLSSRFNNLSSRILAIKGGRHD